MKLFAPGAAIRIPILLCLGFAWGTLFHRPLLIGAALCALSFLCIVGQAIYLQRKGRHTR